MECAKCGADNRHGGEFCTQCGAALGLACPACGRGNEADVKFCGHCGKPLAAAGPAPRLESVTSAPPQALAAKVFDGGQALEGQRRQVTVLFTDMEGYTPLAESLGEDAVYRLMQRVFEEMIGAVHAHEGTVQEITGDGIMALFGAPVALEDAPVRACRAALDIQERMEALDAEIEAEHGLRPKLRIGMHTGPVVVGNVGDDLKMEFTALGDTVNLASRLESLADAGSVLMSEATHHLVEGFVESDFAGEHEIKGKTGTQLVYRLTGLKSGVTRFDVSLDRGLTQLIGRRRELETLEACWEEAAGGAIVVADIAGEAGIGKSRLAYEFRQRIGEDKAFFAHGHCTADGRATPFLPFIEVVKTSFHITEGEGREAVERKLTGGLEVLGMDPAEHLPYFLNLLGHQQDGDGVDSLAAEVIGIRTRESLQGFLRERCAISPTVLIIEDLHWIDRASEEYLAWAAGEGENMRLLIVCTRRPYYQPRWPEAASVTTLDLVPLSGHSTEELLKHRLGADDLPGTLVRLVVEKAEGNPLFAEEIASYLMERGDLRRTEEGVAFDSAGGAGALPIRLENILMDRVDRRDEGPRAMLQTAAVVGRRFSLDLVRKVAGIDGRASAYARDLERQELIFAEEEGGEFRFKHALVQDAVYDTLLTSQREALHEQVGQAIEENYSDHLAEVADVLAYHYGRTPRAEKAVRYMALAGEKSLTVYSLEEAELRFRQTLELIEKVPGCADDAFLVDVLLDIARVYYFRFDFAGLLRLGESYLARVEALGDKRRLSRFLFEIGYAHVFAARADTGRPILERALALGEETGDEAAMAYAKLGLMWDRLYWSDPGDERRRVQREIGEWIVGVAGRAGDVWLASKALLCLSLDSIAWGRPGEARRFALRLLDLSRETGDPRPRNMGLWALAWNSAFHLEHQEAVDNANESLRIALSPVDRLAANDAKGVGLIMLGRVEEGHAILRDLSRDIAAGGFLMIATITDLPYGLAQVMAGDIAKGIHWIEETTRQCVERGQVAARAFGELYLGLIHLEMAIAGDRPPLVVILRNLGFILRTAPFAAARARRHLEAAEREYRRLDIPSHLAFVLYNLALLDSAKKRADDALARLTEARAIAESVEATALAKKIDAARDALN